jgi:UDP-N-acetylglucosamine--N-acetylmuramyl-(pentapeptide) pyrophosphoryl-undecaprenol N-acetylglucosamine transferase
MENFSIIISCGGTGGHFYPGLSIGREVLAQGGKVRLFVAGMHGQSQKVTSEKFGIPADTAKAIRLPSNKLLLPIFAIVFAWTTLSSIFYLMRHRPKAVLVMGSFASVPLGLAAVLTLTPLFLHEGNTVVGKANRLLSHWAKTLYLSFPVINSKSIHCNTEVTGMPIRPELTACNINEDPATIKKRLGFREDLPLILVFGGSQGAQRINQNFYASLENVKVDFQLFHLTGLEDNQEFENSCAERKIFCRIEKSTDNMADAIRAADLIICRAGASSLAELAWFKRAAIFIPLKIAAENHQFHNAKLADEINGGIIIEEDKLTPQLLAQKTSELLTNKEKWLVMQENISSLARKDVTQTLVKSITASC